MSKRLAGKKEFRTTRKSHQTITALMRKEYLLGALIAVLLLGSTVRQPMKADSVSRGLFGGATTGAVIGGLAGGGRGAAIGLGAGALLGGAMGASAESERREGDPYYQRDKQQRELDRLEGRQARARTLDQQQRLQNQIDLQRNRISDLNSRLYNGRY